MVWERILPVEGARKGASVQILYNRRTNNRRGDDGKAQKRVNRLDLRMAAGEYERLMATAEQFELTVSELVRDAIRRHIVKAVRSPCPHCGRSSW